MAYSAAPVNGPELRSSDSVIVLIVLLVASNLNAGGLQTYIHTFIHMYIRTYIHTRLSASNTHTYIHT